LEARWNKVDDTSSGGKQIMTMSDFVHGPSAKKWVDFSTNDLAPLLYPNICRTLTDSYAAFGYVDRVDKFSALDRFAIRFLGSLAMYMAASNVKSKYGVWSVEFVRMVYMIHELTLILLTGKRSIVDERAALDEVLRVLENDGLFSDNGTRFLSGTTEPNLGDLSVFGTLRSIEGLPAHGEVVYGRKGSAIKGWYQRMKAQVEPTEQR